MSLSEIFHISIENDDTLKDQIFTAEIITGLGFDCLELENIHFTRCRFIDCSFRNASFIKTTFEDCDLSNCNFSGSYWRDSAIHRCKLNGCIFEHATLRQTKINASPCRYTNFTYALLELCDITDCDMQESALSEIKIRKCSFHRVDFRQADFFKTSLSGVDLSDCNIDGIIVSESRSELKGLKISPDQALYIASLLGVKIIF